MHTHFFSAVFCLVCVSYSSQNGFCYAFEEDGFEMPQALPYKLPVGHESSSAAMPVIFDTDIGSFVDDVVAIVLGLASSELDVKLVVTCTGNNIVRAKVVAKLLTILGRDDIPIGLGIENSNHTKHPLSDWAKDFNLADYKGGVFHDGVGKMAEVILTSTSTVDIFMIGPMINFPTLLRRYPGVVKRARVKAMAGSIYKGYHNSSTPDPEYNVAVCPWCFRQVLHAGWPVTITPLDTCGVATLEPSQTRDMLTQLTPLVNVVVGTILYYCTDNPYGDLQCNFNVTTPVMYDSVATTLALAEAKKLMVLKELNITVDSDGNTRIDNSVGVPISVALDWKNGVDAYRHFLVRKLCSSDN